MFWLKSISIIVLILICFGCSRSFNQILERQTPKVYNYATSEIDEKYVTLNSNTFKNAAFDPYLVYGADELCISIDGKSITISIPQSLTNDSPDDELNNEITKLIEYDLGAYSATHLKDGLYFVAGGALSNHNALRGSNANSYKYSNCTWIVDIDKKSFSKGPHLAIPRIGHIATILKDNRILLTGGFEPESRTCISEIEIYDPATNTIRIAGKLHKPRIEHSAILLSDGNVLISGGKTDRNKSDACSRLTSTIELFNPSKLSIELIGQLRQARMNHWVIPMEGGKALILRGHDDVKPFSNPQIKKIELYQGLQSK